VGKNLSSAIVSQTLHKLPFQKHASNFSAPEGQKEICALLALACLPAGRLNNFGFLKSQFQKTKIAIFARTVQVF